MHVQYNIVTAEGSVNDNAVEWKWDSLPVYTRGEPERLRTKQNILTQHTNFQYWRIKFSQATTQMNYKAFSSLR